MKNANKGYGNACQPNEFEHSRGDWLGKPANIKVENNGAVVYVGARPDRAKSFVF